MPKTKDLKITERRKNIVGILAKYQKCQQVSDTRAGLVIGRCRQTYQNKMKHPERFEVGELWDLFDRLGVPPEEREVILK